MFKALIKKEFHSSFNFSVNKHDFLYYFWRVIGACGIVALIAFMTYTLNLKVTQNFPQYQLAFICLFLFIVFLLNTISGTYQFFKKLFNQKDLKILKKLPIPDFFIVFSKIIPVFVRQLVEGFILNLPILITLGIMQNEEPIYYFISILFILITAIISVAISLIFSFPIQVIYQYLKNYDYIQFAVATVLMILCCFAYWFFLNLFLSSLTNTLTENDILNSSLLEGLQKSSVYFAPVSFLVFSWLGAINVSSNIIFAIVFLIAVTIIALGFSILFYGKLTQFTYERIDNRRYKVKRTSAFRALLSKELKMTFRDNSSTFSYTSILIVVPFLAYIVLYSFKRVMFTNLSLIATYMPHIIDIICFAVILLFVTILNSNASLRFSKEGQSLSILKTTPSKASQIILSKILIPAIFSSISLIAMMLVLIFTKTISMNIFWLGLVSGLLITYSCLINGVYIDMRSISSEEKSNGIAGAIAIIYAILLIAVTVTLEIFSIDLTINLVINSAISLVLLALSIINLRFKYKKAFDKMETHQV